MIEIKNAEVLKSGTRLFQHFNWQVRAHEHWLIAGANGSGKTTLLEMIAGIVHLASGELKFDFTRAGSWDEQYAERKRSVFYIPAHAIQTFLHQQSELYYQQRYYSLGDEQALRVKDILGTEIEKLVHLKIPSSLSIDRLLELDVKRLSNGQLKKVLFIKRLLSGMPRILMLDYPFEGLDRGSRVDLCAFLDFLVVSHGVQLIVVDHHHLLPKCINRKLTLVDCRIEKQETISGGDILPYTGINRMQPNSVGEPIIEIENLAIKYGDQVILAHFNWVVRKGERWALVGRNGAGKTTLFSMIFADHPLAYSQKIVLFGKRRGTGESIWDIKRRINYVGSELLSYLQPESILLTAREYFKMVNKQSARIILEELISYFEVDHFVDKPVRTLSSGQLQLMMMINGLVTEKELFLLDEPFQFLDKVQRTRLSRYLQSRMHADVTLILITHDEADLATWAAHTKAI